MVHRNVTLADIARESGVSKATVSLVMRDSDQVSEATRERVRKVAHDLGYVYNRAAAALRSKTTGTVGLIVTTVANPFFAEVVDGLEGRFTESGRSLILTQHSDSLSMQRRQIEAMLESRVDGVVIVPAYNSPAQAFERLSDAGISMVFVTRRIEGQRGGYVGADNITGARMAAEHLIEHGCRRIAFIGGAKGTSAQIEREAGAVSAVARTAGAVGIASHSGPVSTESSYAMALEVISGAVAPDGIVAYNDIVALGIQAAIADSGRIVGRDIRLVGFDDVAFSHFLRPSITSVQARPALIGSLAAETLVREMEDPSENETVLVPTSLSIRESCGCSARRVVIAS